MQMGSVVWEEFDHIHTYIHTEFGQCGYQYTRNAQYQTCFACFDKLQYGIILSVLKWQWRPTARKKTMHHRS